VVSGAPAVDVARRRRRGRPARDRERTLDRAVEAILAGTSERMADFAGEVRGPATALYAFGVLLPLALVALLPAAGVAGVAVTPLTVILLYDVLLPTVVTLAGGWLLLRRPVAFPPARIPRSHPARRSSRWPALLAGVGAGIVAGGAGLPLLPRWTIPILAVGVAAGVALVVATRPIVAIRREVRAAEEHLPDALYLIGRRVSEGTAVEAALIEVAAEVPGETGDILSTAAGVQDRLRVGVEAAFLGEHGALSDLPSVRLRSAATMLGAAAREGRPAGRAVIATGDHLSDLAAIERDARRDLATVTDTLRHTGAAFGPLVGGATVRLSEGMVAAGVGNAVSTAGERGSGEIARSSAPPVGIDPTSLGLAVGAYVLLLAVVLTVLSVGLQKGLDRALVGYRAGQALITAALVFVGSYLAAGLLV
jgi:Flp pilus assembly protein TadB